MHILINIITAQCNCSSSLVPKLNSINRIALLEKTISETEAWMSANMLKLNVKKNEFIVLGTCQQLAKVNDLNITIGNAKIVPVTSVRNLGYFVFEKWTSHQEDLWTTVWNSEKHSKTEMPP